ncbi:MAG: hypothetical protein AAGF54_06040 [Pseudomonadota bacterium]
MPLVPRKNEPIQSDISSIGKVQELEQDEANRPSDSEVLGANFRLNNPIASTMASAKFDVPAKEFYRIDPEYNTFENIEGYEEFADNFDDIFNEKAATAVKLDIDRERKDRRTVAASSSTQYITSLTAATLLDPTILLPGGTVVRGAKLGHSIAKSAKNVGIAAGAATAVQEIILQGTQETRTAQESITAVGGSVLIGSLIGAGAPVIGRLISKKEYAQASKSVENYLTDPRPFPADEFELQAQRIIERGSVGAAATPKVQLEDLDLDGLITQGLAKPVHKLNPLLRLSTSPSTAVREISEGLFENPVYLKKNHAGETAGPAVETSLKQYQRGAVQSAVRESNKLRREAIKVGSKFRTDEWNERIGIAMRNGDVDIQGNPNVTKAAQAWRKYVFDPLKQRAIDTGLLPEDVSVQTATSYLSRLWNPRAIEADEIGFKRIVTDWADGQITRLENAGQLAEQFVSEADRLGYLGKIADDIFNQLTGRTDQVIEYALTSKISGPLKERTFNIADNLVQKYLENDVELVGKRYARVVSADAELKDRFGSTNLTAEIERVGQEYAEKRAELLKKQSDELKTADADKAPKLAKQHETALNKLNARETADVADIKAVRDLLRGVYRPEIQHTNFARALNAAQTFNYITALGDVLASSLTDVFKPMMVHGFSRVFNTPVKALSSNLKKQALRLSKEEAEKAGAVSEVWLQSRISTLAELADPYAQGTPVERFLDNASVVFSKATGLNYWNDFLKNFTSTITQDRLLSATADLSKASAEDKAYVAFLGINQNMATRIAKQFAEHGETIETVKVAHTDRWTDLDAVRAYRSAINKDVDSIIVTKGVADTPLFANTPLGRAMLQFKSFALASHQRTLMRAASEVRNVKQITSFGLAATGMMTTGMLIYYWKQIARGKEPSDNPGTWIAEGFDRSGLFSLFMEVNNIAEKVNAPGIYRGLASAFPDASQQQPASRYAVRNLAGAMLGPTFGKITDLGLLTSDAFQGEIDPRTARKFLPFGTLPYIKPLVDIYAVPAIEEELK